MDNKFFDFEKAKVQTITLEQLERTHKENDVYNNPLKGIYHFQLLNEVINMCNEQHFNVEVYDLFAAQNKEPRSARCCATSAGRSPVRR